MGAVAGILNLAGTGIKAYGEYKQGQDASKVYKYNQALANYQAQYIQDEADIEEAQLKRDVSKYISRQRVIAGMSGTDAGLGVLEATQKEADIDAAIIRYKADLGSWSAKSQANLFGTYAKQFGAASYLNAGSTLLTSASKFDWKNIFKKNTLQPMSLSTALAKVR